MAEIGKTNKLKFIRISEHGVYLDGENLGEILLPNRYVPKSFKSNDEIEVFVFLDSEDRITAGTDTPYAQLGDFALLKAISVNSTGAWLDWGLPKDLLVPFSEQKQTMIKGKSYLVFIYLDQKTERLVASAKLNKFLSKEPPEYKTGSRVDLLISHQTDIGYNVIINNSHWGLLFKEDVFQKLETGQRLTGYIKRIRSDKKIDLTLQKPGYESIGEIAQHIFGVLLKKGGYLEVTDKSSPDVIKKQFGLSKKSFKKAIGDLYKKRVIILEERGIRIRD